MYLAKLHRQHDMVLRILLEDLKQHAEALRYIHTLDFFEAEKNIKQYGKDLMAQVPEETTKLLMELCSTYSPITDDAESLFALDTKGSCRECYSSLRLRDRSSPITSSSCVVGSVRLYSECGIAAVDGDSRGHVVHRRRSSQSRPSC